MKRWVILLLVVMLVAGIAAPALAAGNKPPKRMPFNLVGRITAVDTGAATVAVEVVRGNRVVKPFIGKTVTVQVTASTRLLRRAEPEAVPITLADLKVGDAVSIHGVLSGDAWTASRITVGAELSGRR